MANEREHLNKLIEYFRIEITNTRHSTFNARNPKPETPNSKLKTLHSTTPIQVVIIPGNKEAKAMAEKLQQNNLDVRAILYPSVPKGSERLRIVLHSFNTFPEVDSLLNILAG